MHARWIREAGIDGVSLGNNHAMDYGADGLNCMEQALDKAGVGCTGAGRNLSLARQVIVKTLPNGVRVGLISALAFATPKALFVCTPATPQSPGVNPFDPKSAAEWISEAHRACDVLVVALHGGVERRPVPNTAQRAFAHLCIDAGADVVWGHHPHVLEGAELYHGKPILYSMGNLISSLPASSGLVKLIFSGNKVVKSEFLPLLISQGRVTPLVGSQRDSSFRNWLSLGSRSRRAPESPMPFTLAKVP
jgi:poly-gamma-glutamate synthesis protein (capsule biosynthesis protein)